MMKNAKANGAPFYLSRCAALLLPRGLAWRDQKPLRLSPALPNPDPLPHCLLLRTRRRRRLPLRKMSRLTRTMTLQMKIPPPHFAAQENKYVKYKRTGKV